MQSPNVLILDEPTNDLGIATLRVLEDFLDEFAGIVITVSHDRYFLDRTVERIAAFENGNIVVYEGDYTEYQEKSGNELRRIPLTVWILVPGFILKRAMRRRKKEENSGLLLKIKKRS